MPFDRKLVRLKRSLADTFSTELLQEVVVLIRDRVAFLASFLSCDNVLVLGSRDGAVARSISPFLPCGCIVYQCDLAHSIVSQANAGYGIVADDESVPFKRESIDFIISNLSLHNVNDLFSVLSKISSTLRKSGVFVGATFGRNTLWLIKKALVVAEGRRVVSRIQPFTGVNDILNTLQSSGFSDIVADVCVVEVMYQDLYHLFKDIKRMGEGNTLCRNYEPLKRKVMEDAWYIYKKFLSMESEDFVPVQFEIILMKGNRK